MKVTIKEWHAVASWRWDMPEDEVCGICRVQFDGTCPTCKFPGDDCTLCMYDCFFICHHFLLLPDLVCLAFSEATGSRWLTGDCDDSDWKMWTFVSYGMSIHNPRDCPGQSESRDVGG